MEHPKESGISRRQLLRRSAGARRPVSAPRASSPAVRTRRRRSAPTTPRATTERRRGARRPEAARPGRAAAAAPRQLGHLGDHRRQQADRRRRQARGRPAAGSTTTPTTSTRRRSRSSRSSSTRRSRSRPTTRPTRRSRSSPPARSSFDLIIGLSGSNIVDLIAQQAAQAAQPLLPAEPREEHLARAGRPVLRPRRALHGPVRRLDGRDRLAQRQGHAGRRRRWTCRGTSSGSRRPTAARSAILDDRRDALSMPMQRDAMRTRRPARPQHRGPGGRRQGAARPRRSSARSATRRSRSPTTRRCPRARRCCTSRGRATCSAPPSTTCRRASRRPCSRSGGPEPERRRPERLLLHRARRRRARRSRTSSSTSCSTRRTPTTNFVNFTGYTPPQKNIDAEALIKRGADPEDARRRRSSGPTSSPPTRSCCSSASRAQRSGTTPGRSSRPADGRSRWTWRLLALPGVAWLSVFFLVALYAVVAVAFGNQDTLSQPVPFWNPLDWNVGYVLEMLREHLARRPVPHRLAAHVRVRRRSRSALSLLIGYPVAYFTARHAGRWKGLVLLAADPAVLDQLPDADAGLDQPARARRLGHAAAARRSGSSSCSSTLGLLAEPGGWLNGQPSTVIIALVYGYIPFLILPLFAALDRIDQRQIEAARDLGASPLERVPARDAAALGARDPRRRGADRAADVRRLLHRRPRLGVDADEHDRQPDRRVHAPGLGEGRPARC